MSKVTTFKYTTHLKGDVTVAQAVTTLQDHTYFLETDPNMLSFQADVAPSGGPSPGTHHPLPDAIHAVAVNPTPRCYEVQDRVPGVALFSKLLGKGMGTTTIYYEITDTKDGIFVFLRAPLGVTQERRWRVEEDGGNGVRMVEYVTIFCNRLLFGSVKSQQDEHWRDVHAAYAKKMGGEAGEQVEGKVEE